MARPMVLMQEELLNAIWLKHAQGVPVLALIRQYKLDDVITAPTLTKLLSYMKAKTATSNDVSIIIHKSLFPAWLDNSGRVQTCPTTYYYTGRMPLGKWLRRDEELPKAVVKAKQVMKGKPNGKR